MYCILWGKKEKKNKKNAITHRPNGAELIKECSAKDSQTKEAEGMVTATWLNSGCT